MSPAAIVSLPWSRRPVGGEMPLVAGLARSLAWHLPQAASRDDCARWAAGVREARPHWNRDFDGEQFSLGRAWYTHLEQGQSQAYFAGARASDALVERFAPGLQAAARGLLSELLGCEVTARRGWCGPGVHVFPAGEAVARAGGVIHSDVEGLSPGHLADRAPALSAVLMLAPPERGGGLRLWDACHHDDSAVDAEALAGVDAATVEYAPGDLVVFDSYRLHQIQAFAGDRDRLSLTIHVARLGPDRWESWF